MLFIVHRPTSQATLFDEVVGRRDHRVERWAPAVQPSPRWTAGAYDAVVVYGGPMHPNEDERFPWLSAELEFVRGLVDATVPLFGICLGAQLLARAAGGHVYRAPIPEIGWHAVGLTEAGSRDPVLGVLPGRFVALEWHHYGFEPPAGAVVLARSAACTQAFALESHAWGVQFHPEATMHDVARWADGRRTPSTALLAASRCRLPRWYRLGRELAIAFCEAAERVRA